MTKHPVNQHVYDRLKKLMRDLDVAGDLANEEVEVTLLTEAVLSAAAQISEIMSILKPE